MKKKIFGLLGVILLAYFALLIPEQDVAREELASVSPMMEPFVWNQDAFWLHLQAEYAKARALGCENLTPRLAATFSRLDSLLLILGRVRLEPIASPFTSLEQNLFECAPYVAACDGWLPPYIEKTAEIRSIVKEQSRHWDMKDSLARRTLYRLLYGGRAALEEVLLQMPASVVPTLINGTDESSQTPWASILGVKIHSGDILVSRGGAPTSALIARGSDFPGNFSHIALVHVDPKTHLTSILESHIEQGVTISTLEDYLNDTKLRVMVLRLRSDLPELLRDPMLPHRAATLAFEEAALRHIPYDFEMDYKEHSRLFCSEVASAPYQKVGITLWMGISTISTPGLRSWLGAFGVRNFVTQEPSDLEYDPQLVVVAEWRDPMTLYKDHLDNAVIDVMLERAEEGEELGYPWYALPAVRLLKGYSLILNVFGGVGPVPEGMNATAALRNKQFSTTHEDIRRSLDALAEEFHVENGYRAPYWGLVRLARSARDSLGR
jgi:hypothetical protein